MPTRRCPIQANSCWRPVRVKPVLLRFLHLIQDFPRFLRHLPSQILPLLRIGEDIKQAANFTLLVWGRVLPAAARVGTVLGGVVRKRVPWLR